MNSKALLLTDKSDVLLDWLEFRTLTDPDKNGAVDELRSQLRITGSEDALEVDGDEAGSIEDWEDPIEAAVTSAFLESEFRSRACGEQNYPFTVETNNLSRDDTWADNVYSFLLILSRLGPYAAKLEETGAKLFEELCAHAARSYLGWPQEHVESYVFGFPRRLAPSSFVEAVEDLCQNRMREGCADRKFPNVRTKKDASLDVVAWRGFPDRESSKLIVFGQCATGNDWWEKRNDLQPQSWCGKWLLKHPAVPPLKAFFVPHRVPSERWPELTFDAGVVFDRCRLSHLANASLPAPLREQLKAWSAKAIAEVQ
jgi:hypothetical protein